jgi:hypothetical protein
MPRRRKKRRRGGGRRRPARPRWILTRRPLPHRRRRRAPSEKKRTVRPQTHRPPRELPQLPARPSPLARGAHTTRKKPIRGIQNLVIGGVLLYAMGKTVAYRLYATAKSPTRGVQACTPRLQTLPMAYRPIHHGCVLYLWCTGLYASGVFHSSGVRTCMPRMCTPQNVCFVCHGCVSSNFF